MAEATGEEYLKELDAGDEKDKALAAKIREARNYTVVKRNNEKPTTPLVTSVDTTGAIKADQERGTKPISEYTTKTLENLSSGKRGLSG